MNQDLQKFIELLKSDDTLQEKMRSAAEKYEGDQTAEAVFRNLLLPIAEKKGYHFTWEDYQEYVKQETKELNPDEMDQVAGGVEGEGYGYAACFIIGSGNGYVTDTKTGCFKGACLSIGIGAGLGACISKGIATEAL